MFRSFRLEQFGDGRPLFALFHHMFHQDIVLPPVPLALEHSRVQIVIPMFPTLLRGFKVLFARDVEEIPRYLVPIRIHLIPLSDHFLQQLVLFLVPRCHFFVGNRFILKFESLYRFALEYRCDGLPILVTLNENNFT